MKSEFITLTDYHLSKGFILGRNRRIESAKNNRQNRQDLDDDIENMESIDFQGAFGETAAYVYFKEFFPKIVWNHNNGHYRGHTADFDDFIDVKTTKTNALIIPRDDHVDDWAYVGICCNMHPTYEIFGWCWCRDALHDVYLKELSRRRKPPYVIDRNNPILQPIETLKQYILENKC